MVSCLYWYYMITAAHGAAVVGRVDGRVYCVQVAVMSFFGTSQFIAVKAAKIVRQQRQEGECASGWQGRQRMSGAIYAKGGAAQAARSSGEEEVAGGSAGRQVGACGKWPCLMSY